MMEQMFLLRRDISQGMLSSKMLSEPFMLESISFTFLIIFCFVFTNLFSVLLVILFIVAAPFFKLCLLSTFSNGIHVMYTLTFLTLIQMAEDVFEIVVAILALHHSKVII